MYDHAWYQPERETEKKATWVEAMNVKKNKTKGMRRER